MQPISSTTDLIARLRSLPPNHTIQVQLRDGSVTQASLQDDHLVVEGHPMARVADIRACDLPPPPTGARRSARPTTVPPEMDPGTDASHTDVTLQDLAQVLGNTRLRGTGLDKGACPKRAVGVTEAVLRDLSSRPGEILLQEDIPHVRACADIFHDLQATERCLTQSTRDVEGDRAVHARAGAIVAEFDALAPGQTLWLHGGWAGPPGHAMVYALKKVDADNLDLRVFNAGGGWNLMHRFAEATGGENDRPHKRVVETEFRVNHVPASNLGSARAPSPALSLLVFLRETTRANPGDAPDEIYGNLLPALCAGGTRVYPGNFATPQDSGTCAWRSLREVIRAEVPRETGRRIKLALQTAMLNAYLASRGPHWEPTPDEALVLNWARKDLHGLKDVRRGILLPAGLAEVQSAREGLVSRVGDAPPPSAGCLAPLVATGRRLRVPLSRVRLPEKRQTHGRRPVPSLETRDAGGIATWIGLVVEEAHWIPFSSMTRRTLRDRVVRVLDEAMAVGDWPGRLTPAQAHAVLTGLNTLVQEASSSSPSAEMAASAVTLAASHALMRALYPEAMGDYAPDLRTLLTAHEEQRRAHTLQTHATPRGICDTGGHDAMIARSVAYFEQFSNRFPLYTDAHVVSLEPDHPSAARVAWVSHFYETAECPFPGIPAELQQQPLLSDALKEIATAGFTPPTFWSQTQARHAGHLFRAYIGQMLAATASARANHDIFPIKLRPRPRLAAVGDGVEVKMPRLIPRDERTPRPGANDFVSQPAAARSDLQRVRNLMAAEPPLGPALALDFLGEGFGVLTEPVVAAFALQALTQDIRCVEPDPADTPERTAALGSIALMLRDEPDFVTHLGRWLTRGLAAARDAFPSPDVATPLLCVLQAWRDMAATQEKLLPDTWPEAEVWVNAVAPPGDTSQEALRLRGALLPFACVAHMHATGHVPEDMHRETLALAMTFHTGPGVHVPVGRDEAMRRLEIAVPPPGAQGRSGSRPPAWLLGLTGRHLTRWKQTGDTMTAKPPREHSRRLGLPIRKKTPESHKVFVGTDGVVTVGEAVLSLAVSTAKVPDLGAPWLSRDPGDWQAAVRTAGGGWRRATKDGQSHYVLEANASSRPCVSHRFPAPDGNATLLARDAQEFLESHVVPAYMGKTLTLWYSDGRDILVATPQGEVCGRASTRGARSGDALSVEWCVPGQRGAVLCKLDDDVPGVEQGAARAILHGAVIWATSKGRRGVTFPEDHWVLVPDGETLRPHDAPTWRQVPTPARFAGAWPAHALVLQHDDGRYQVRVPTFWAQPRAAPNTGARGFPWHRTTAPLDWSPKDPQPTKKVPGFICDVDASGTLKPRDPRDTESLALLLMYEGRAVAAVEALERAPQLAALGSPHALGNTHRTADVLTDIADNGSPEAVAVGLRWAAKYLVAGKPLEPAGTSLAIRYRRIEAHLPLVLRLAPDSRLPQIRFFPGPPGRASFPRGPLGYGDVAQKRRDANGSPGVRPSDQPLELSKGMLRAFERLVEAPPGGGTPDRPTPMALWSSLRFRVVRESPGMKERLLSRLRHQLAGEDDPGKVWEEELRAILPPKRREERRPSRPDAGIAVPRSQTPRPRPAPKPLARPEPLFPEWASMTEASLLEASPEPPCFPESDDPLVTERLQDIANAWREHAEKRTPHRTLKASARISGVELEEAVRDLQARSDAAWDTACSLCSPPLEAGVHAGITHAVYSTSGKFGAPTRAALRRFFVTGDAAPLREGRPDWDNGTEAALRDHLHTALVLQRQAQGAQRALGAWSAWRADPDDGARARRFADALAQTTAYPTEQAPALLTLEATGDLCLRTEQVEVLGRLWEGHPPADGDANIIQQMIMGAGKSSVLLPLLSLFAHGAHRGFYALVPDALLSTVLDDLHGLAHETFGIPVRWWQPEVACQLTEETRGDLAIAASRGVVLSTPSTLLLTSLRLLAEWRHAGRHHAKSQAEHLARLLENFGESRALVDEVHEPYHVGHEVVVQCSGETPLPATAAHAAEAFFQILQEADAWPLPEDGTLPQSARAAFAAALGEQARRGLAYLTGPLDASEPDWMGPLHDADPEAAERLAIWRLMLKHVAPSFAHRRCGEHFGPPETHEPGAGAVSVPYDAGRPKPNTSFSDPLEAVMATWLTAQERGMDADELRAVAERDARAIQEASVRYRIDPMDTEPAKRWRRICPPDLLGAAPWRRPQEVPREAWASLCQAVNNDPQRLTAACAAHRWPQITVTPSLLRATGFDLPHLFGRLDGWTGTPAERSTFPTHRFQADPATDAVTTAVAFDPERSSINRLSHASVEAFVDDLLTLGDPHLRAWIDAGGVGRHRSNADVAAYLAARLPQAYPDIRGIMFYDQAGGLCLWKHGDDTFSRLPGSGSTAANASGLPASARFTYFDRAHCTGANVPQERNASAVVSVDVNTGLTSLQQAMLRMRAVESTQRVIFAPDRDESRAPESTDTPASLWTQCARNDARKLGPARVASLGDAAEADVRQILLRALLRNRRATETFPALLAHLLPFFEEDGNFHPRQQAAGLMRTPTQDVIQERLRRLETRLSVLQTRLGDLECGDAQLDADLAAFLEGLPTLHEALKKARGAMPPESLGGSRSQERTALRAREAAHVAERSAERTTETTSQGGRPAPAPRVPCMVPALDERSATAPPLASLAEATDGLFPPWLYTTPNWRAPVTGRDSTVFQPLQNRANFVVLTRLPEVVSGNPILVVVNAAEAEAVRTRARRQKMRPWCILDTHGNVLFGHRLGEVDAGETLKSEAMQDAFLAFRTLNHRQAPGGLFGAEDDAAWKRWNARLDPVQGLRRNELIGLLPEDMPERVKVAGTSTVI